MKKLILVLLLSASLLVTTVIQAQILLNQPESVVFDSLHNRYLVSNFGDGNIVQIDEFGNQSYFDTTLTRIAGLLNKRDTLFVASNDEPYIGLVAYSLHTDEMLFYLPIPSVGLLNDLDYDNRGYIYLSDYWDNKLWRVDMSALSCTLFVDPLPAPNGVLCDTLHNRLLVISVNTTTSPILAIDFTDGSVSLVVNTYGYAGDGLARDDQGRVYTSEWSSNSCHRYDTLFTHPPQTVSSGHDGPADIYINRRDNILCVPNFYRNDVDFIQIESSAIEDDPVANQYELSRNYPNPFNSSTTIEYNLPVTSNVLIEIFDIKGGKLQTLVNENQPSGWHRLNWNATDFSTGMYFYKLRINNQIETGKMILLK